MWACSAASVAEAPDASASSTAVARIGVGCMFTSATWADPFTCWEDTPTVAEALKSLMGSDPSTRYQLICDNAEALEVDV